MFGMGTQELMVILLIAFLVFGGRRLPELGSGLGKGIASFRRAVAGDGHSVSRQQVTGGEAGPGEEA